MTGYLVGRKTIKFKAVPAIIFKASDIEIIIKEGQ
jgi:hypothetical protein